MMPTGKASGNAVLAKARALYGSRLRADDYRRLMGCRTMPELAAALKEYPLYAEALAEVNPQYARRVQLELADCAVHLRRANQRPQRVERDNRLDAARAALLVSFGRVARASSPLKHFRRPPRQ